MNWEAIGAIAEAGGVIAIFISLVYVATQIRQNTEQFARSVAANELAAFERNIESGNRIRELLIVNPELTKLLLRGFRSYGDLEAVDKMRFGMLLRNVFSELQGAYVRQLSVAHDPLEFEGSTRLLDEVLLNKGVREWLETNDPDWRPVFREFVDQRVATLTRRMKESTD